MFILRGDLADRTIAHAQWLLEQKIAFTLIDIDTGWGASDWDARRLAVREWLKKHNTQYTTLSAPKDMASLAKLRGAPSQKFSWCTLQLKGLPFLDHLDKIDPNVEATIIVPRVRAYLRYDFLDKIESDEHYGDRSVWHPLRDASHEEIKELVERTPIPYLDHGSLACAPCIYHQGRAVKSLSKDDKVRLDGLESALGEKWLKKFSTIEDAMSAEEQRFNTGCGDPFGCDS